MLFRAVLFLFTANLFAQVRIGDWRALTCPLDIRDIAIVSDTMYCATGGGLLIKTGNQFATLTTIDGLNGVDISVIAADGDGYLWLGGNTPNGFIQIYDPIKKNSVSLFDYGLTEITGFWIDDTLAFAAFIQGQDVGLMK